MMKNIFTLAGLLLALVSGYGQNVAEIEAHRQALNAEFADPETSPLPEEDREYFTALDFYPISTTYRVEARFVRTPGEKAFEMKTSTARAPRYVKYGEAQFELGEKKYVLSIYQNLELVMKKEFKNHLFVPFNDFTNGEETYGGGRYLDLEKPQGESIIIDFNKAYNPYCAYNDKYSCPIPPAENQLEMEIRAGVKGFNHPGH